MGGVGGVRVFVFNCSLFRITSSNFDICIVNKLVNSRELFTVNFWGGVHSLVHSIVHCLVHKVLGLESTHYPVYIAWGHFT